MNVFLTFDIEVWCDGWDQLEAQFPSKFERYVHGRSSHGSYALPETLAILQRHKLQGVFFVEPLFSARFGPRYLETIVSMIREAGQDIQLHLHPEWTNEAIEPLIPDSSRKRQHLTYYTLDEQAALIAHGRRMLEQAGAPTVCAFRAGSYAANRHTYQALARNGIWLDTSLNRCFAVSGQDLREAHALDAAFTIEGVTTLPVTVLKDGFGRDRPAQVGACSAGELENALTSAQRGGVRDFVVVSHNFEMLRQASSQPDWIVVRRFERLCSFLAAHPELFSVRTFRPDLRQRPAETRAAATPHAHWWSTGQRYAEQVQRRWMR